MDQEAPHRCQGEEASILILCHDAMTQCLRLVLTHSSGEGGTVCHHGKARQQESERVGPTASTARKQRETNTTAQLPSSFLCNAGPQPTGMVPPHPRWVFPPQPNQSGNSLLDTPRGLVLRSWISRPCLERSVLTAIRSTEAWGGTGDSSAAGVSLQAQKSHFCVVIPGPGSPEPV